MAAEIAEARWYYTADKSELVPEGDARAAFLAAIPGRKMPPGVSPAKAAPEPAEAPAETSKPKRTTKK